MKLSLLPYRKTLLKKKSLVFWKNKRIIDLPVTPGIYFVYRKQEQLPFYCGEAGNLKKRLQYHFSDSDSAIQYSTLKKYFDDINERTLRVMSDMLSIKIIEVPFCRWNAEEFFHKKYSITLLSGYKLNSSNCLFFRPIGVWKVVFISNSFKAILSKD